MSDLETGIFLTGDQIAAEEIAYRLYTHPDVQPWLARVADDWRKKWHAYAADHGKRFERAFAEAAFAGLLHAACDDPLYPRLYALGRLAHRTNGLDIPGTHSAHPNPDYIYRFVAIDGQSHYVLRGRMPANGPVAAEYALLTKQQRYQQNLSLEQFSVETDGSFEITFDPLPANGRPNHFQTTAESAQILLRDVIGDGARQNPIPLTLVRSGPAPERGPRTFEEILANAEWYVRKHINDMDFTTEHFALATPANQFAAPKVQAGDRYSAGQAYSAGNFHLQDGESLVITLDKADAAYAVAPVTDIWGWSGELLGHVPVIGTDIAAPNSDGTFTFVIAEKDPLVANWIDTGGLRSGILFFRWIGLRGGRNSQPRLEVSVAAAGALSSHIPQGAPTFTPDQRSTWLRERVNGISRVFA